MDILFEKKFFFLVFAMFSKHMLYNVQYLAYFESLWESAKCLQKFFLQGPIFKGLTMFQVFTSILFNYKGSNIEEAKLV